MLEAESRAALGRALPRRWIVRDEQPDYGVDLSVETVNEQDSVTGRRFFVQLKATDEPSLGKALAVKFKQKNFRYLQSLSAPVFIVRYHAPTRRLFARWVHDLDVFYAGRSASHFTFHLTESDALGLPEAVAQTVERALEDWHWIHEPTLAGPLLLQVNFHDATIRGAAAADVAAALQQLTAPVHRTVEIREAPTQRVRGEIDVTTDDVGIRFYGGGGAGIHRSLVEARSRRRKTRDAKQLPPRRVRHDAGNVSAESIAADILSAVAMALLQAKHVGPSATVAEVAFTHATITRNLAAAGLLAAIMLQGGHHVSLARAATTYAIAGEVELSELIVGSVVVTDAPGDTRHDLQIALDEWLSAIAGRFSGLPPEQGGTAHYNVARYVGAWDLRRGVAGFVKAARLYPSYRKRPYFWEELGAMLFHLERFAWSACAYGEAARLGAPTSVFAKQADALWRTGRYGEARSTIERYDGSDAHWLGFRAVLPALIQVSGTELQVRDSAAAAAHIERARSAPSEAEEYYTSAIKADAMSGLAWYNLAITFADKGEHADAAMAFLITAFIQPWDIQAWANTILAAAQSSAEKKETATAEKLFGVAALAGAHRNREELFRLLLGRLVPDDSDGRRMLRELLATVPEARTTAPVLRVHAADGMIELPLDDPEKAFRLLAEKAR